MKAWLLCESCVHAEEISGSPKYTLINECSACAKSCFTLVSKLVSQTDPADIGSIVLDCLLHCRQCSAECRKYAGAGDIRLCGEVCTACGDSLKELTSFSLN